MFRTTASFSCARSRYLATLEQDGFAVVENVTDLEDINLIRSAIEKLLRRSDVPTQELGERGGLPQIIEILRPSLISNEIAESRFVKSAKAISEEFFGQKVTYHFDHAIIKPPMNLKETPWHQDQAYAHRFNVAIDRLHWWLPLHDVSSDQGCMQFVRGSHQMGRLPHVPVAATSDAIKTSLPKKADVVTCPLRAGSATVHLPATLHHTGPNKTSSPRYAFILHIARSNWATSLRYLFIRCRQLRRP
jgi:Phytanoyl-CoA dioxygenase (PhyH)